MDLMSIRRGLMMFGGGTMVGEFSKYQKVLVTPTASNELTCNNTLGVIPKLVIVRSAQSFETNQYIISGYFDNMEWGAVQAFNSSGGHAVNGYSVFYDGNSTVNGRAYLLSDVIKINPASASRVFNTSATYTIEIYA